MWISNALIHEYMISFVTATKTYRGANGNHPPMIGDGHIPHLLTRRSFKHAVWPDISVNKSFGVKWVWLKIASFNNPMIHVDTRFFLEHMPIFWGNPQPVDLLVP